MDIDKVDEEYRKFRDRELQAKLEECVSFLDNEHLKQVIFKKVLGKYVPHVNQLTEKLTQEIRSKVVEDVKKDIKLIVSNVVEDIVKNKIQEMISEDLDSRFRKLINEDY